MVSHNRPRVTYQPLNRDRAARCAASPGVNATSRLAKVTFTRRGAVGTMQRSVLRVSGEERLGEFAGL
jgi:hypothetical protein